MQQSGVLGTQGMPPPSSDSGAQHHRPQSAMSNVSQLSTDSVRSVSSNTSNSSVILQLSQSGQQMPPLIYKKPKTKTSVKRAEREAQRQVVRQELGIGALGVSDPESLALSSKPEAP